MPIPDVFPSVRPARRPRRGADHWRGVIQRLDASGLSVADFCAAEDLSLQSVYHWRRRLRELDADATADPPRLLRLEPAAGISPTPGPAPGATDAVAELRTGDRVTVPLHHLTQLIAALRTGAAS